MAVDLTAEMIEVCQTRLASFGNAQVMLGNVLQVAPWTEILHPQGLTHGGVDAIAFSLILEHLSTPHLDQVFAQCVQYLSPGGQVYLGELHPFKQYQGSQARVTVTSQTDSTTACCALLCPQPIGLSPHSATPWVEDGVHEGASC